MASHHHLFDSSTLPWKLGLVAVVIGLTLLHLRWPKLHALQSAIVLASLAIVWLGLELASGQRILGTKSLTIPRHPGN